MQGCEFFNEHGIIIANTKSYYWHKLFEINWVRIEKRIFRNHEAYREWADRYTHKITEVRKAHEKALRNVRNLNGKRKKKNHHKAIGRREKAEKKAAEVSKALDSILAQSPNFILHSDKLYYICYEIEPDEVLNNTKNSALVDTILFNMEKFNES